MQNNRVLYIINGPTRSGGKVGVSGGDVRLFEVVKNAPEGQVREILTTPVGKELLEKFEVPYDKLHLIQHETRGGIASQLGLVVASVFGLPKSVRGFRGTVYSSCEHLYDVLPALYLRMRGAHWKAVYHWVEDYPWKEKRGGTPALQRYAYWLQRFTAGLLIKWFANEVLGVSFVTTQKLKDMKDMPEEKLRTVACGVNTQQLDEISKRFAKQRGKAFDAVFMKRLNSGKGVWDLLEAWKRVVAVRPQARLCVIGDGPEEVVEKLKAWTKEQGLTENIHFEGVVYDVERKFELITGAKVFVLPTHEENWAIVIGEAMGAGVPVVCYALKEIQPIWQDNVAWVPVGDVDAFAKTTLELLDDEAARTVLAKKAHAFVQRYDWKVVAAEDFAQ